MPIYNECPAAVMYDNVLYHTSKLTKRHRGPGLSRSGTNAADVGADTAKVQEWLRHTGIRAYDVSTIRVYDHLKARPEH